MPPTFDYQEREEYTAKAGQLIGVLIKISNNWHKSYKGNISTKDVSEANNDPCRSTIKFKAQIIVT